TREAGVALVLSMTARRTRTALLACAWASIWICATASSCTAARFFVVSGEGASAASWTTSRVDGRGRRRGREVKDASSLLRFSVAVFRPCRAVAVILADQRTAAVRYAGWRPRAPGEA